MAVTGRVKNELKRALQTRYREAEDQLKTHLVNLALAQNLITESEVDRRIGVRLKLNWDIIKKVDRRRIRKIKTLNELEHKVVTDIVGGRVVLDYRDQTRKLCEGIRQCPHWKVVRDNRCRVSPDTGYRSHHIDVVLLTTTNHKDIRCEIQVRTLLQHTFASWSHPIYERYRENTTAIPAFFRGRLRQISDNLYDIDKQVEKLHNEISRVINES